MIGWYVHDHGTGHRRRLEAVAPHLGEPVTGMGSGSPPRRRRLAAAAAGRHRRPAAEPAPRPTRPRAARCTGRRWASRGMRGRAEVLARVGPRVRLPPARRRRVGGDAAARPAARAAHGRRAPAGRPHRPGARARLRHRRHAARALARAAPRRRARGLVSRDPPRVDRRRSPGFDGRARRRRPRRRACPAGAPSLVLGRGGHGIARGRRRRRGRGDRRAAGTGTWRASSSTTSRSGTRGSSSTAPVADVWPLLCRADVVVGPCGGGLVADVAAAGAPFLALPQPRPFDEQAALGRLLAPARRSPRSRPRGPPPRAWPGCSDGARRPTAPRSAGPVGRRRRRWRAAGSTGARAAPRRCPARRTARGRFARSLGGRARRGARPHRADAGPRHAVRPSPALVGCSAPRVVHVPGGPRLRPRTRPRPGVATGTSRRRCRRTTSRPDEPSPVRRRSRSRGPTPTGWLGRHGGDVDVLHVHFGIEQVDVDGLAAVLDAADAGRAWPCSGPRTTSPTRTWSTSASTRRSVALLARARRRAAHPHRGRGRGGRATGGAGGPSSSPHPHLAPLDVLARPRPARDRAAGGRRPARRCCARRPTRRGPRAARPGRCTDVLDDPDAAGRRRAAGAACARRSSPRASPAPTGTSSPALRRRTRTAASSSSSGPGRPRAELWPELAGLAALVLPYRVGHPQRLGRGLPRRRHARRRPGARLLGRAAARPRLRGRPRRTGPRLARRARCAPRWRRAPRRTPCSTNGSRAGGPRSPSTPGSTGSPPRAVAGDAAPRATPAARRGRTADGRADPALRRLLRRRGRSTPPTTGPSSSSTATARPRRCAWSSRRARPGCRCVRVPAGPRARRRRRPAPAPAARRLRRPRIAARPRRLPRPAAGHRGARRARRPGARVVVVPIVRDARLHPYQALVRLGSARASPPVVPYHDLRTLARAAGRTPRAAGRPTPAGLAEVGPPQPGGAAPAGGASTARSSPPTCSTPAGAGSSHTLNHPGNPVLVGLAQRVLDAPGRRARRRSTPAASCCARSCRRCTPRCSTCSASTPAAAREGWLVDGEPVEDAARPRGAAALVRRPPRRGRRRAASATPPRSRRWACEPRCTTSSSGRPGTASSATPSCSWPRPGCPTPTCCACPRRVTADDLPALLAGLDRLDGPRPADGPARVHLHVTDHLLGRSPEEALAVVAALAARGPVSLTLHDLPQPSDGTPGRPAPGLLRGAGRGGRRRRRVQRPRGRACCGRSPAGDARAPRSGSSRSPSRRRPPPAPRPRAAARRARPRRRPTARPSAAGGGARAGRRARLGVPRQGARRGARRAGRAARRRRPARARRRVARATPTCSTAWPPGPPRPAGACTSTAGSTTPTCPACCARSTSRCSRPATSRPRRRSPRGWPRAAARSPPAARTPRRSPRRAPGTLAARRRRAGRAGRRLRAALDDPATHVARARPSAASTRRGRPADRRAARLSFAGWHAVSRARTSRSSSPTTTTPTGSPSCSPGSPRRPCRRTAFEVVVADDGSPGPAALPAAAVPGAARPAGGPRVPGRRRPQPRGARPRTGRVLCFLDGDTVPEPGYLAAVLDALDATAAADLRRPGRHGGGPRRRPPPPRRPRRVDAPTGCATWFDGARAPRRRELDEPAWLLDGFRWTDDLRAADDESYRWVIAAVLSMHRSLFDRVGGFEESFASYGGEDWEVANRCWLAGAQMRHVPEAVAWHDGVDFAGREVDRRAVQNGAGRDARPAAALARHPPARARSGSTRSWSPRSTTAAGPTSRPCSSSPRCCAPATSGCGCGTGRSRPPGAPARARPAGPGRRRCPARGAPPVPRPGPAVRARRARRAARASSWPARPSTRRACGSGTPGTWPATAGTRRPGTAGGRPASQRRRRRRRGAPRPARTCPSAGSCAPGPSAPADPSVRRPRLSRAPVSRPREQPRLGLRHRRGPPEVEALVGPAAVLAQEPVLLLGLHALGDHGEPERPRERQDHPRDGRVGRVAQHVLDERAVDLDLVQRQPLEVAERGVPGPEVVQGERDAVRAQPVHGGDDPLDAAREQALGDLQPEQAGVGARLGEDAEDVVDEAVVGELPDADVDRHGEARPGARPRPSARGPRRPAAAPTAPAAPRARSCSASGTNAAGGTRPRSGCCQRTSASTPVTVPSSSTCGCRCRSSSSPATARRRSTSSASCSSTATCIAGSKKRNVFRPADLAWYIARSAWRSSSSTACPWASCTAMPMLTVPVYGDPGHDVRQPQLLDDELGGRARRDRDGLRGVAEVLEHDDELVAAEPHDHVALADAVPQPGRDLLEQLVADVVAAGVVEGLEVVEVDEQQRPAAAGLAPVQHLQQEAPVGQAGQGVVVGEPVDLLLGALALGEVGVGAGDAHRRPGRRRAGCSRATRPAPSGRRRAAAGTRPRSRSGR